MKERHQGQTLFQFFCRNHPILCSFSLKPRSSRYDCYHNIKNSVKINAKSLNLCWRPQFLSSYVGSCTRTPPVLHCSALLCFTLQKFIGYGSIAGMYVASSSPSRGQHDQCEMDVTSREVNFVELGARKRLSVVRPHHTINSLRGFKTEINEK